MPDQKRAGKLKKLKLERKIHIQRAYLLERSQLERGERWHMALRCIFFRDESADLESFSLMYSYELASCLDTDTIQNQTAIAFLNGAELCEAYYKEVWIVDRKSVAYNRAMIKSIRSRVPDPVMVFCKCQLPAKYQSYSCSCVHYASFISAA